MRRTFCEQVLQVAARYARRTMGLAALIVDLAVVLDSRAGAAVLSRLAVKVLRTTVMRLLMAVPVTAGLVPALLSAGDFALRRRNRNATLHRCGHPPPGRCVTRSQGVYVDRVAARASRCPGRET
ncbi:hypothetical protein ACFFR7_19695 [Nonomuraea dietziae]